MTFVKRHIGLDPQQERYMLDALSLETTQDLIAKTVPKDILESDLTTIPGAMTEAEYLRFIRGVGARNQVFTNFIGQGYYGTLTPSVILRNIFENPGWYTQYTPYQAEISQGRLEALLNFQTMISDLTGMPIVNASLLDEGTAAAEAMILAFNKHNKRGKEATRARFFVDQHIFGHVYEVLLTRAEPLGIEIVQGDFESFEVGPEFFGILLQYPNALGAIPDYEAKIAECKAEGLLTCISVDLMALTLLKEPGQWGVDMVVGNTQRFGVPMGFGGPHAAFFATHEKYKRSIPGRIIGVSKDRRGQQALRMALQTREQHIKREKATSNICTAQALLAVMAGMYAVYHGADGLRQIASDIHAKAQAVHRLFLSAGLKLAQDTYFDTLTILLEPSDLQKLRDAAEKHQVNLYYRSEAISLSVDESTTDEDLSRLAAVIAEAFPTGQPREYAIEPIPAFAERQSNYLEHEVFNQYRSETTMMRYIKSLENKDLSLVHSMIPLGSCTMKLNAATQLMPLSWPEWNSLHPFVPMDQSAGYAQVLQELEDYLSVITGFTACSLQPNSGAQGEYTGLLAIREYHKSRQEEHRSVALIPTSAHGTNPASAVMAGMQVILIQCDENGNIDLEDLRQKCEQHSNDLAALMVTYPSTHGVFEKDIRAICRLVHDHGGLVYMDGANMNAQVGLTSPGAIGADVCHLNLHKTFSIPHGGGGPGMGPICVNDKLKPFLPKHSEQITGGVKAAGAVSSAPWGSASILLISYAYIRLLGGDGMRRSTVAAILSANYIAHRLQGDYDILYKGHEGLVAHELIVDLRPFKAVGITAEDVAKRLIDYGFHAPTLSFPVSGTIMIEPTESEDIAELDRFCDAMLAIRNEIDEVARGEMPVEDNVLSNAPHTVEEALDDEWSHAYSRQKAVYPLSSLRGSQKFWPTVSRVDNAYGDRNLVCTCPDIMSYAE